ncbi:MAG: zinc dependent phospholipase C family protein [Chitinophagaceae bacterium]
MRPSSTPFPEGSPRLTTRITASVKRFIRPVALVSIFLFSAEAAWCWGFYGHQKINFLAVFLLPPEMIGFYKSNINYLSEHAVDPDKRRYMIEAEGPRHYIDIDTYGKYPFKELPHNYDSAVAKFGKDSLQAHGIVPWWTVIMLQRLTKAFRDKDKGLILKLSAELGHYAADAHVPLHACHNHNGQYSNQKGIHAFWESRIPELLADKEFDFLIGKARHIANPSAFIWKVVLESASAADTVLHVEKELSLVFPSDQKYAFESRNGKMERQYSTGFSIVYNRKLNGMIERRMRQSIQATANLWYTAWVNAGQPNLKNLATEDRSPADTTLLETLNERWKQGNILGKDCDQ